MSRGGIETQVVENAVVALGGNDFETGLITVPANGKIAKGTVLKREGEKFAPLITTVATVDGGGNNIPAESPVAVNPFDIENKSNTAADLSIRAIIGGPVRADLLTINGQPITTAQRDLIRDKAKVTAVLINDISRTE